LLLTVIAAAALVIAGAAVIILTANQPPRPRQEYVSSYQPDVPQCPNWVTMLFKTDEAMLQAAPQLERDTRFYDTVRETKAQNYERFKRTYADQPELIALAKVEAVPASVTFSMSTSSGRNTLLAELKNTYAPVDIQDPCEFQTTTTTTPSPTR
jgi:hypothetical protein